ncbi:MAG: N-acetylmuramoyl-L-alanine amidase [Candidatus Methylomirabilota bacterium]
MDAGHGGTDSGAVARSGAKESVRALAIAGKLQRALAERGQQVFLTRTNNTSPSPGRRARMANEWQCDAMVSIHCNDDGEGGKSGAHGLEVWHHDQSERGKALAQAVLVGALAMVPELANRGLKRAGTDAPWARGRRPSVISDTRMPAVIVECGFMSSDHDVELLGDEGTQRRLAEGIAGGVGEWGKTGLKG